MKFASGQPLTEGERDRCIAKQRKAVAVGVGRRKACPSRQRYDQQPTEASIERDRRIMGETEHQP